MTNRPRVALCRTRRRQTVPAPAALCVAPVGSGKTESAFGFVVDDRDGPVLVTTIRPGKPPQHPGQLQLPGTGTGGDGR